MRCQPQLSNKRIQPFSFLPFSKDHKFGVAGITRNSKGPEKGRIVLGLFEATDREDNRIAVFETRLRYRFPGKRVNLVRIVRDCISSSLLTGLRRENQWCPWQRRPKQRQCHLPGESARARATRSLALGPVLSACVWRERSLRGRTSACPCARASWPGAQSDSQRTKWTERDSDDDV